MTKPTIVTRADKGSALTWTEGDSNLTNLRDATITVKADTGGTDVVSDLNGTVTLVAGTNVTITGDNTAKTVTINSTASGGASALSGLSDVSLGTPTTGEILQYNGTAWTDVATSTITAGVASTVALTADNSTNATNYPLFSNAATGNLSPRTDTGFTYNPASGTLTGVNLKATNTFLGADCTGGLPAQIYAPGGTNIDIWIQGGYNGSTDGVVRLGPTGHKWPNTDGTSNQVLVTNGAGVLSWATPSGSFTTAVTANNNVANSAKLTIGSNALSSTAWTTTGIGLRAQAATYTDTSSTAGTVAASHIHAIAAPTMASTNAITVTDAATLYVATRPTAGTNTTITNGWAILTAGNIKAASMTLTGALTGAHDGTVGATTPNTGAFTTLSASSTVSGTGFSTYLASPPAIGGTTASTVRGTTITATTAFAGALNGTVGATTPNTGSFTTLTATGTTTLATALGGVLKATAGVVSAATAGTDYQSPIGTISGIAKGNGANALTAAVAGTDYVAPGGALGTPSSGTVTNLTGTASININGTVGATTPSTGAFTTLSSTGAMTFKQPIETTYDLGTTGGTIAPDCSNGSVQKITLNSALTLNAFTSPVAGQSLTLIIYGGTAYTSITSTMKFAGGVKTLTGTAGCIDILSIYYDGTNYFASLGKGYA